MCECGAKVPKLFEYLLTQAERHCSGRDLMKSRSTLIAVWAGRDPANVELQASGTAFGRITPAVFYMPLTYWDIAMPSLLGKW